MNILDIQVMRGPNYWSNYRRQLIVMKLDLGKYEELPTDEIPGFPERLISQLPSLEAHHCSRGKEGGFCERLREGTWLGHVVEHVALELQYLAGMDCGYGRTRGTGTHGIYNVVFSYTSESAGKIAAREAVALVSAIAEKRPFNVKQVLKQLKEAVRAEALGPSTQAIVARVSAAPSPSKSGLASSTYQSQNVPQTNS